MSNPPHPPIADGTPKSESGDVNNFVSKIVQKALKDHFPSANSSNSMTTPPLSPTILFRPNNYRLGVKFSGVPSSNLGTKAQHSGLIFWRKGNITVQVGKRLIVGIWNQGKDRQTWKIGRDSYNELEQRLDEIKEDITKRIRDVVDEYVNASNLVLDGDYFWVRHEDWVKGEDYIDKLPKEFTIHDSVFKKVYNESAIEFIGGRDKPGTVEIKQYIKNRVIEDFAPEIVNELSQFNNNIKELREVTLLEIENKKLHMSVLHDMKDTLHSIKDNAQMGGRFQVSHAPTVGLSSHPENVSRDDFLNPQSYDSSLLTISKFDDAATVKRKRLLYYKEVFGW